MLLSQLEVNFGIISACVPTVLRIVEEFFSRFLKIARGACASINSRTNLQSHKGDIQLSSMDRSLRGNKHAGFRQSDENDLLSTNSGYTTANIIPADHGIRVDTSFTVERYPRSEIPEAKNDNWPLGDTAEARVVALRS
jgi:hypothetical protein